MFTFIDEYVKTGVATEAARAAGYTENWAKKNAYRTLRDYEGYVSYLQKLVTEQRAKILALDTQTVLDEIARLGMLNEFDYLVREVGKDGKVSMRRKELHEMSRDEMVGIKITRLPNGKLVYDLRDKDPMLIALGKNLGLFNEKLIIERRNLNMNAKMDLSNVSTEELRSIISSFENMFVTSGKGRIIEAK